MICDKFWGELTFTSKKLNLDKDGFIAVTRLSLYKNNSQFRELIDLVEGHRDYFDMLGFNLFKIL